MSTPAHTRHRILLLLVIGILPFELNGLYNLPLSRHPAAYWLVEILTWIVLPIIIAFLDARWKLFRPADIGLHSRVAGFQGLGFLIPTLVIVPALLVIVDQVFHSEARNLFPQNIGRIPFSYRDVIPSSGFLRILALAHLCLTAGIVEEIYFRGMARLLFPETAAGGAFYVIVTSLVFSSIHWEGGVWNLTETFVLGVAASSAFLFLRNLWPLIIGHALCDLLWFT